MQKITAEIDEVDKIKLDRLAKRIGIDKNEIVKILITQGPEFFLAKLVGATKR